MHFISSKPSYSIFTLPLLLIPTSVLAAALPQQPPSQPIPPPLLGPTQYVDTLYSGDHSPAVPLNFGPTIRWNLTWNRESWDNQRISPAAPHLEKDTTPAGFLSLFPVLQNGTIDWTDNHLISFPTLDDSQPFAQNASQLFDPTRYAVSDYRRDPFLVNEPPMFVVLFGSPGTDNENPNLSIDYTLKSEVIAL
ncbi:hypothetical protein MMC09_005678 [Bachmanniomyces sp. S44760]|nr:hypothetical protein [Bachmanniomyces sp. S44760]